MKSLWKKEVKTKIEEQVKMKIESKKKESKKMRFLQKKGHETYLREIFNEEARMALKIRLNPVEWIDGNYGKETLRTLYHQEKDTTEW